MKIIPKEKSADFRGSKKRVSDGKAHIQIGFFYKQRPPGFVKKLSGRCL